MLTRTLVLAGMTLIGICLATVAQPPQSPEAMRTHADELARQAAELRSKGEVEKAKALAREAEELLKNAALAERDDRRPPVKERQLVLEAELAKLRADRARLIDQGLENAIAPIDQRIAELERELGQPSPAESEPRVKPPAREPMPRFKPQPHPMSPQEIEALQGRIHHLRVAADNLHAAGLHDHAKELEAQAQELERELDRLVAPQAPLVDERIRALEEQVDDLRNEVRAMREEIMQLRSRLDQLAAIR